jgi:adenylosuccinate lyase
MAKSNSYAETVNGWEELLAALEQNSGELSQLELPRQRLQSILDQIKGFAAEQSVMTASRQIATSRIEYQLVQGRKLATVLRTSVREHYGNRSEKVAEFGLQPLRTRSRRSTENPLPPVE